MSFRLLFSSSFLLFISFHLFAQSTLLRCPYLNVGTSESMVIRWRTSGAEIGEVRYGLSLSALDSTISENAATEEHELVISNLKPETKYFYSIGTNGTLYTQNIADYSFQTSPEIGKEGNYRFWVLGDFGNGSQAQIDVKTGFLDHYTDKHTDGWIWLGDNAYGEGTDQQYQENVFEVYPEVFRNTVVWPNPGNHDYKSVDFSNNGPYFDNFTMPTMGEAGGEPSGEEGYYSFDYGNVHFVSINSEYLVWVVNNNNDFTDWLEKDLQNTEADFIIAYWHQSAYSKGTHDSDDPFSRAQMMRENIVPIIEKHGVDLVLTGHSHSYERSYLINGHYDKSNTFEAATMLIDGSNGNKDQGNAYVKTPADTSYSGTVYATVGCGGQKGDGSHALNHPIMYMSTEDYHGSMVIDVSGKEMTCRFIDTTGAVLDEFSIQKGPTVGVSDKSYDHNISMQAYPNPFKKSFFVEFDLPKAEEIELSIYDVKGALIERVVKEKYAAGKHSIEYSPKAISTNGIYLLEIKTGDNLAIKRLIRQE